MKWFASFLSFLLLTTSITACNMGASDGDFPLNDEDERRLSRGKLTGEGGLTLFGKKDDDTGSGGASPIGVNSFLWRATLDTLSFMPMASADPFGGVILTNWYEDPAVRGERFKITALILDRKLRADGIKVSVFKQKLDESNQWRDVAISENTAKKLEDTILTRARQLKVKQEVK
jgi:hypothetical protein